MAVSYEAGPTGFDLYRMLTAAGIRCEVAAPSRLDKPAGDRVKTDARDALHLARLLPLDEVTSVAIPSVDQEAARDLVRAREDCRGDLMRAPDSLPISFLTNRTGRTPSIGQGSNALSSLVLQAWDDVGVHVESERDRRMPQSLANDLCRHPGLEGEARVGMPEVMEPDRR